MYLKKERIKECSLNVSKLERQHDSAQTHVGLGNKMLKATEWLLRAISLLRPIQRISLKGTSHTQQTSKESDFFACWDSYAAMKTGRRYTLGHPYLHVVRRVSLACGRTNKYHQGLPNEIRLKDKTQVGVRSLAALINALPAPNPTTTFTYSDRVKVFGHLLPVAIGPFLSQASALCLPTPDPPPRSHKSAWNVLRPRTRSPVEGLRRRARASPRSKSPKTARGNLAAGAGPRGPASPPRPGQCQSGCRKAPGAVEPALPHTPARTTHPCQNRTPH